MRGLTDLVILLVLVVLVVLGGYGLLQIVEALIQLLARVYASKLGISAFGGSSFWSILVNLARIAIAGFVVQKIWQHLDEDRQTRIVRYALIGTPYSWLLALFLVPFFIVLKIALSDYAVSIPPYTPTLDFSEGWAGIKGFFAALDFENFWFLTSDDLYWKAYLSSLWIAFLSTLVALFVGYPIAYAMAQAPTEWRPTLMLLVILPFWTSFLIRVYSWMGILSEGGLLNQLLLWSGLISEPLTILNTNTAVYIGIVYTYLPFMILPIYAALEKLDESLLEAAEDLGCSRIQAFWIITVPLSKNGIIAGCFLVFIPALGEFVIPSLLGGSRTLMIGKVLWEEFFNNRDWPVASAVAVILLLILVIPIILFQRNEQKSRESEG